MDKEQQNNHNSEETGLEMVTKGKHPIHCLTVIGQIEGHYEADSRVKTTKYEHVIPQLIQVEEDGETEGLLVILNTVGGDVEAGLALAELIKGMSKPTASLVLGGGHSIGIPLAVSADRSFIVPTATMTVHPVRHSGTVPAAQQTAKYLDSIQQRVTDFIVENCAITTPRLEKLMHTTDELIMDIGTTLDGRAAVKEGIIDSLGGIGDALGFLYSAIEAKTDSSGNIQ